MDTMKRLRIIDDIEKELGRELNDKEQAQAIRLFELGYGIKEIAANFPKEKK